MSHSVSLLCAAVSVIAYLNTLDLHFCFDDNYAILQNQDVTQPQNSSWTHLLVNDFWGMPIREQLSCKSYRPLCVATFRLNYLLHELQPMGYHLVNVLLHGAVCYLYVQLCGVVFSQVWPALIAGLLFAVHPIHTEAVAGVVGRAELLSGMFFILSILVYQKSLLSQWSLSGLIVSQMLAVFAMLSKEQGITAVGVCCVCDLLTIIIRQNEKLKRNKLSTKGNSPLLSVKDHPNSSNHHPSLQRVVIRCTAMLVFAGVLLKLRVAMAASSPSFHINGLGAHSLKSPFLRCLNYSYLVFVNLWLLLNPSFLCADWTGNVLTLITMATDPRNLLTILTFSSLILTGVYGLKSSNRPLLMSLSLMIIPFLPASNLFFPVGFVVAERVLYLPSMGFCMLVSLGAWKLMCSVKKYKLTQPLLVALLAVHLLKTTVRNRDWHKNETLAISGIKLTQQNGKLFTMLAKVYSKKGDLETGEALSRLAVSAQPDNPLMLRKLIHNLQAQKKYDEAELLYGKMIKEMSNNGSKLIGKKRLGRLDVNFYAEYAHMLLRDASKMHEAKEMLYKAVQVQPESGALLAEHGRLLLKLNEPLKAVTALEQAVTLKESNPDIFSYLGTAYTWLGQLDMAEVNLKKVLTMAPHHRQVMMSLAFVLHLSNKHSKLQSAVKMYNEILDDEPTNVHAALQLGDTHTKLGNLEEAVDAYNKVSKMGWAARPLYKLALTYKTMGRHFEAKETLRTLMTKQSNHVEGLELLLIILKEEGETSSEKKVETEIEEQKARNRERCEKIIKEAHLEEKRDPEKADQMLEMCLKIDPTYDKARTVRGYHIVRSKIASKYMKAKELFSDVISHHPDNIEALFGLGLVHQTTGRHEEAKKIYTTVLQHNPEQVETLFNLGYLLSEEGHYQDAVSYLKKVLQLKPTSAEAKALIRRCHTKMRKKTTNSEDIEVRV